MALSLVSVDKQEFDAAKSGGYVYGYVKYGTIKAPVYIDLGEELEYSRSRHDDPNTFYKLFLDSTIYYAKTDEDLDNDIYFAVLEHQTVKIFF